MIRKLGYLLALMGLTSALHAQTAANAPTQRDVYCAGLVTDTPPPSDTFIVSGMESSSRITFSQGDMVYINRGSSQGVQAGSEFFVSRRVKEPLEQPWFVWQNKLLRAMGSTYADVGRIRVVHVETDTSTAEVEMFCEQMQRGDIVTPFVARQVPSFKPEAPLDIFAPSTGKSMAMIVTTRGFGEVAASGTVVYVNLGSSQGVKIGDYYRVFRFQGDRHETVYEPRGMNHAAYGFGTAPGMWKWMDLPREIIGEGLVLNVSPNASTVLITNSLREIYPGDYVEIE
jgi:hypothetical protein